MSEWDDSAKAPLDPPIERRHAEDPALKEFMREGRAAREANLRRLADLSGRVAALEGTVRNLDDGQLHIIKLLERNTEITEQIRDIRTTGKIITKVVLWFGGIAGSVAAVVGLWFSTWGKK